MFHLTFYLLFRLIWPLFSYFNKSLPSQKKEEVPLRCGQNFLWFHAKKLESHHLNKGQISWMISVMLCCSRSFIDSLFDLLSNANPSQNAGYLLFHKLTLFAPLFTVTINSGSATHSYLCNRSFQRQFFHSHWIQVRRNKCLTLRLRMNTVWKSKGNGLVQSLRR